MRFDRYTVILLTLRPDAPVMTGDERYRGFSVWSMDQQTARGYAEADPAVQIGRLAPRSVAEAMAD